MSTYEAQSTAKTKCKSVDDPFVTSKERAKVKHHWLILTEAQTLPAALILQGALCHPGEAGMAMTCAMQLAASLPKPFGFNEIQVAFLFSRTALDLVISSSGNLNSKGLLNEPHIKEVI